MTLSPTQPDGLLSEVLDTMNQVARADTLTAADVISIIDDIRFGRRLAVDQLPSELQALHQDAKQRQASDENFRYRQADVGDVIVMCGLWTG